MANFIRSRTATWVDGATPSGAELEQLEVDHVKTINATDGSVHAPTGVVNIGGVGLMARHRYDNSLMVVGADADTTYTFASAQVIFVDNTLTADRTYTLGATGTIVGDVMDIVALPAMSTSRQIIVKDNAGTELVRIGRSTSTYKSARFVFLGTTWRLLSAARNGLATIDAGGVGSAPLFTTSSTSATDVPGHSATLQCVAGDVMLVRVSLAGAFANSGETGEVHVVVIDGGTPTLAAAQFVAQQLTSLHSSFSVSYAIVYTVVNTGSVTWKTQVKVDPNSPSFTLNVAGVTYPATISLTLLRQ